MKHLGLGLMCAVFVIGIGACSDDDGPTKDTGVPLEQGMDKDGGMTDTGGPGDCVGFWVEQEGEKATLTNLEDKGGHGMMGDGGMTMGDGGMGMHDMGMVHDTGMMMHDMGMMKMDAGQLGPGVCITITKQLPFTVTTQDGAYTVEVSSVRGDLTHDAADHEGLSMVIKDKDGAVKTGLTVKLFARMPHHTGMGKYPKGHGTTNDFNVQGLAATEANGAYVVDPIDFAMPKYWFVEVDITDTEKHETWFALEVGGASM